MPQKLQIHHQQMKILYPASQQHDRWRHPHRPGNQRYHPMRSHLKLKVRAQAVWCSTQIGPWGKRDTCRQWCLQQADRAAAGTSVWGRTCELGVGGGCRRPRLLEWSFLPFYAIQDFNSHLCTKWSYLLNPWTAVKCLSRNRWRSIQFSQILPLHTEKHPFTNIVAFRV